MLTTATFVMAGVESLSSFMSVFALNLHDYPDARRRLVADPALIAAAIEESLRFNTSAQRFKRVAMRDVELHGKTIRAGDKVALAFGSANRDRRKFADPDRYDIDRRPLGHLGFGSGKHFCLGSPDGAAGHGSRHAPLPRARARLPPDGRQNRLEFVVEFQEPVGTAVCARLGQRAASNSSRREAPVRSD